MDNIVPLQWLVKIKQRKSVIEFEKNWEPILKLSEIDKKKLNLFQILSELFIFVQSNSSVSVSRKATWIKFWKTYFTIFEMALSI